MKKLFKALEELNPGCEVLDVRFGMDSNYSGPVERDMDKVDAQFAHAIKHGREVSMEEVASWSR